MSLRDAEKRASKDGVEKPRTKRRLNLGCGDDIREGWCNVDIQDDVGADIVHDLENLPWRWANAGQFELTVLDNVLEHIRPRSRPSVIDEIHRVLEPGGELICRIPVPPIGGGWDLTHYAPPSWEWPQHPRHADKWEVLNVSASRVGVGRGLPESAALAATKHGVAWAVDEVELVLQREP